MNAVDLLYDLVGIYSPSRKEKEISDYLARAMGDLGFEIRQDSARNAIGTVGEGPELLLFSHMDTVPGELPVRRTKEKVFGRGAVDAKGPLAALVWAASRFVDKELPFRLVVAGVTEEECETSLGVRTLMHSIKPRLAILGEPSGCNGIGIAYRGRLLVEVSARGHPHHTASFAHNPADALMQYYLRMKQVLRRLNGTSMNVSLLHGGDAAALNVIPAEASFTADIRVPARTHTSDVLDLLRNAAQGKVHVKVVERIEGVEIPATHSLVRVMTSAVRENGLRPRLVKKMGSSDMNIIGHSVPTVVYGPGDSRLDHTTEEALLVGEYLSAISVLESALENLRRKTF